MGLYDNPAFDPITGLRLGSNGAPALPPDVTAMATDGYQSPAVPWGNQISAWLNKARPAPGAPQVAPPAAPMAPGATPPASTYGAMGAPNPLDALGVSAPPPGFDPAAQLRGATGEGTAPTPVPAEGPAPDRPGEGRSPAPQGLNEAQRQIVNDASGGATPASPGTAPPMPPDQAVSSPVVPPGGSVPPSLSAIGSAIYGQESGSGANPSTSVNGARGGYQIMPDTFKQYARPGERIDNQQDNTAVGQRIIADLGNKTGNDPARIAVGYFSGPGNIAPPGSPTPWKTDSKDGNGKSTSSYVSDIMGRLGQPQAPQQTAQVAPTATPNASPGADQGNNAGPLVAPPQSAMAGMMPFDPRLMHSSPAEQLQALASGLLSGGSLAQGLGAGFQNLGKIQAGDRENYVQGYKAQAQLGLETARTQAMYGPKPVGTPTLGPDGKTMQQGFRNPMDGSMYFQPIQGTTTAQQAANNGAARVNIQQQNADRMSNMFNYKTGEGSAYSQHSLTQAMKDGDAFGQQAIEASNIRQSASDIRTILQQQPNAVGRDITARVGQFLTANLGIPVNGVTPDGLDLAQKNVGDLSTSMIKSRLGGAIGRVPLGEYNQIAKGVASAGTNRDALLDIVNKADHLASVTQGVAADWEGMTPDVRKATAIKYGGFKGYENNYWQQHVGQADAAGQPVATVTPTIAPKEGGGFQSVTPSGVSYSLH